MFENIRTGTVEDSAEMASTREKGELRGLAAAGGILGAIAVSSCCILPLVLTVAGVSGAWMINLRALALYQPIFIAMTIAVLGYGFYLVYWKPKRAYADGAVCVRPLMPNKVVRGALWFSSLIVALAFSFPYWFPLIVPSLP